MVICELDKSQHESYEALNKYLGRLRVKQETYYREHIPRFDLLTGEPIPYKNTEQYLSTDFTDKRHLKRWLKENPVEGRAWAVQWLKKRKADKNLVYAPSHVELRSLSGPSMHELAVMTGKFEGVCAEAGLINRYKPLDGNARLVVNTILTDTREQKPLVIDGVNQITIGLKVGDYALPEEQDRGIYIDRKSLNDFIGTMTKGLSRFSREIERAASANHYLIMLVESDINSALSFNHLPHIKRHVKAQPAHVFKGLRDLLALYPAHFQCVFVDGRVKAAAMVKTILSLGEQARAIDIQFETEEGRL